MAKKIFCGFAILIIVMLQSNSVYGDIITDGAFSLPISTADNTDGEFDARDTLAWYTGGNNGPNSDNGFLEFKNNQTRGAWQVVDDSLTTTGVQLFTFDYQLDDTNGNLDYSIRIYGINDPSPQTSFGGNTYFNGTASNAWNGVGGTLLTQIETGDLTGSAAFTPTSRLVDFGAGYDFVLVGFFASDAQGSNVLNFDNVSITSIPEPTPCIVLIGLFVWSCRRRSKK